LNFKRKTIQLIFIATIIRIAIASIIGLGNDEVYYRMYAQDLQWNYFDHPPMVGWMIRLTTFNLFLDSELFIRCIAIISSAVSTWMIFLCGKKIKDERTGFIAASMYTATVYGSIISGLFILPDSPQMIFWSIAVYQLLKIADHSASKDRNNNLLMFGLMTGIGMLCKIHTAFLWIGFLMYVLFHERKLFKNPYLYISGIITVLFFAPVIKWNIDNHFVTYNFHSGRVNDTSGGFNFNTLITFLSGQVFYSSVILFPFFIIAISGAFKNKWNISVGQNRVLLYISLPLIIVLLVLSCFNTVFPHWSGPSYFSIVLLASAYFSKKKNAVPAIVKISTGFILFLSIIAVVAINNYPGTLGSKKPDRLGEGDFTLDIYGWKDARDSVRKILEKDDENGIMTKNAVFISNKWFPAAHIDYYIAIPLKRDLIAVADTGAIHQYAWINANRKSLKKGEDAYCLVPSNYYFDAKEKYASMFNEMLKPEIFSQIRSGNKCREFYLIRFRGYKY
jgi:hypothetical protein